MIAICILSINMETILSFSATVVFLFNLLILLVVIFFLIISAYIFSDLCGKKFPYIYILIHLYAQMKHLYSFSIIFALDYSVFVLDNEFAG